MQTYQRSALGQEELQQRKLPLPARARTLLLLLESAQLNQLDTGLVNKIANQENYQILLQHGLIVPQQSTEPVKVPSIRTQQSLIKTENQEVKIDLDKHLEPTEKAIVLSQQINLQVQKTEQSTATSAIQNIPEMQFSEIQKIMQNTLQQYCGLMAKQLIISIAQAQSIEDIRLYQSKWLTTLFESRINRQELNQLLFIINQNLKRLESFA
ncbi:hypothetical protein BJI46_07030 [Acinetobacter qingfengensis]|uniref:Uncharacterized protein n=2 Tax=Acinetobacter qingfengensis TaxID=1262585 RepID=A0A1E7QWS2_9GAMM|nr:hypothetical protein BJI46_07030 [Acinetobacter qingfengensis]